MCQRPSPAPGITAQAVFRREDIGWSSPPAAAPSGRSRRCSAGRGSSHAAPDPASSPAPADPPPEVQPDPRQRRQGFRPFAVHRQPQGSVSSEVHAPVADNHYLFAAQVVPAAVDEGFICRAAHRTGRSAPQDRTGRRFSSAPPRRWGRYALLR